MSENLTPAVRFNGFTDDWEQRKLGELFSERAERSSIGELISVTINQGVVKAAELDRKDSSSSDKSNYKKVKVGDIAYNSMRMWQGASGYSLYSGILSPAYTVIFPRERQNIIFWSYKLKTNAMLYKFRVNSQGLTSDTWNLKYPLFSKIRVSSPKLDEQTKIASLLSTLDTLITLCQRKLELMQRLKKAMLQQMFPDKGKDTPQLRFNGFNDAWEQRKLGELLNRYKELASKDGTYPHVSLTKEGVVPKSDRYDRDFLVRHEDKQYRVTHLNDICYNPANLKFGVICRNTFGNGIFSPIYVTYQVNADLSPEFIGTVVTRIDFIKRALKYQEGTVYERMSVAPEDLEKMDARVPSKDEQNKITMLISALNKLIESHHNKLDNSEQIKKHLLQTMFV